MLDLTKFKGHTPGPWRLDDLKVGIYAEPDIALIVAVPDLLAEVRRLRVLYTNIYDCCSKYNEVKAVHKILKLIGAELEEPNGS